MTEQGIYYDPSRVEDEHLCSCCDKPIDPIFKATRYKRDWMYRVCDECLEECCADCCDESKDDGKVTCSDCIQSAAIKSQVGKEKP